MASDTAKFRPHNLRAGILCFLASKRKRRKILTKTVRNTSFKTDKKSLYFHDAHQLRSRTSQTTVRFVNPMSVEYRWFLSNITLVKTHSLTRGENCLAVNRSWALAPGSCGFVRHATLLHFYELLELSAGLPNKNKDKKILVITCCQKNHLTSKELTHQYL